MEDRELVESAGGENPVAGGLHDVALLGVLRQVAYLAGAGHGTAVGLAFASEDAHRRRLARAVASDEADPVPGLYSELLVWGIEQGAGPDAHLKILGNNHNGPA